MEKHQKTIPPSLEQKIQSRVIQCMFLAEVLVLVLRRFVFMILGHYLERILLPCSFTTRGSWPKPFSRAPKSAQNWRKNWKWNKKFLTRLKILSKSLCFTQKCSVSTVKLVIFPHLFFKSTRTSWNSHVIMATFWTLIIQLYMIRTMLESMIMVRPSQAKNSSAEAKQLRSSLDSSTIDLIEKFHKASLYFKQMLSFTR